MKFKVGDKVKVINSADRDFFECYSSLIGCIGIIESIRANIYVKTETGIHQIPEDNLELLNRDKDWNQEVL